MCWNAEVSLQSFLIGVSAIIIGKYNGLSTHMTLFMLSIVSMQLIEYIVWSNMEDKNINRLASYSAFLLLCLQPLAAIFTLPKKYYYPFLYMFIMFLLICIIFDRNTPDAFRIYKAENGHLAWNWIKNNAKHRIYTFFYLLFILIPLIISAQWGFLVFSSIVLFFSLYNYLESNTWGSMWCWIVNYGVVGVCTYQTIQNNMK